MYARYSETVYDLLRNEHTKALIDKALSTYPLYEQKSTNDKIAGIIPKRSELNQKLLNHYKYREIGFETVGRWLDELEIAMNEIMPYYNQLFHSVDIINDVDDIFSNVNVTETFEETKDGTTSGTSSSEGTNVSNSKNTTSSSDTNTSNVEMDTSGKTVHSETPQDSLSITAKNIDNVSYADNVNWNKDESDSKTTSSGSVNSDSETDTTETSTSDSSASSTETVVTSHTFHKQGNQGVNTYAHDIIEFRQTILNIEQMIINDDRIKELFMLVY